jgi:hypothetical protein
MAKKKPPPWLWGGGVCMEDMTEGIPRREIPGLFSKALP